jgi:hypothetical protein
VTRLSKQDLLRYWRPVRFLVGLVLVALAAWFIAGKTSELSGATAFLGQLRWPWLALAAAAEVASYAFMAALQRSLLRAGDVSPPLRRVTLVTLAGTTIQSALPAGTAFAGLYQFRQFAMFGADDVLAGWVVVATAAVSLGTLSALAGLGLSMAASTGSALDLVGAIVGVWLVAVLGALAWNRRSQIYRLTLAGVVGAEGRLGRDGQLSGPLARLVGRMQSVAPNRRRWGLALAYGTASWLTDGACLMFAFIAVGAPVPWQGLLLAYCGGQLAVNLPITPGGLGVVEGSLTVALVAFGGGRAATVAAVLLYRVVSFWVPLPVGGASYLALARSARAGRRAPAPATYEGAPATPGGAVADLVAAGMDGPGPLGTVALVEAPTPQTFMTGRSGRPRPSRAVGAGSGYQPEASLSEELEGT